MQLRGITPTLLILLASAPVHASGVAPRAGQSGVPSPPSLREFDVNRVMLHVGSDGELGSNPDFDGFGAEYPRGSGQPAVISGGLWAGARVQGDVRIAVADYGSHFLPGPASGAGGDSAKIVWKVSAWRGDPSDTAHVERAHPGPHEDALVHHGWGEYLAFAVPAGAPTRTWRLPITATPDPTDSVDVPGPDMPGDQMLWCVFHDTGLTPHGGFLGGTLPTGLEVERRVFGFDDPGPLGDVVFVREQVRNLNPAMVQDVRLGLYFDQDLCGAQDDLASSDSTRGWGFAYNANAPFSDACGTPPVMGISMSAQTVGAGGFGFRRVYKGLEPAEPLAAWNLLGGFDDDGAPLFTPDGDPTRWDVSGDALLGIGWLDSLVGDRRICATHQPGDVPADGRLELGYALAFGSASFQLEALAQVRCALLAADQVAVADFSRPLPGTVCEEPPVNCPLTRTDWIGLLDQPPSGLDAELLAEKVDTAARAFEWPVAGRAARLRGTLDSLATPRERARAEFAAFLANRAVTQNLSLSFAVSARLLASTPVAIQGVPARIVAELERPSAATSGLFSAEYLNDNLQSRRPIEGTGAGLPLFQGGAGTARALLGQGFDPLAEPDSFATVRIRFDRTQPRRAYRFLRLELADGSAPPQGRGFRYGGYRDILAAASDSASGEPLSLAFVERCRVDAAGTILPGAQQPASFDSTWAPDTSASGGYEQLLAIRRPYGPLPDPTFAADGAIAGPGPWMFALQARLRGSFDVIDDGDAFVWRWGLLPTLGVDGQLEEIDRTLAPGDPVAITRWEAIATGLQALQPAIPFVGSPPDSRAAAELAAAGLGLPLWCAAPQFLRAFALSSDVTPDGVVLRWRTAARLALRIERSTDLGPWAVVGTVTPSAEGVLAFLDPGASYGSTHRYRVAFGIAGPVGGETSVLLESPRALAFGGFQPNPARGPTSMVFTLLTREHATIDVYDVSGRRLLRRDVTAYGPGTHRLALPPGTIRPGVVFVRVAQGEHTASGKGLILR